MSFDHDQVGEEKTAPAQASERPARRGSSSRWPAAIVTEQPVRRSSRARHAADEQTEE